MALGANSFALYRQTRSDPDAADILDNLCTAPEHAIELLKEHGTAPIASAVMDAIRLWRKQ